MKKYEEENYKYENICDKIYPWVKTDSHALNGKNFSKKDAPVISFLGDLNVVFAIKRAEDVYEILKDNMLPPECDIIELYHKSCENLNRDVEFVVANTGTEDLELWQTDIMKQVPYVSNISGRCVQTN